MQKPVYCVPCRKGDPRGGRPSVGKSQAPVFEVDELGSCSQSAPEAFQLCAGSARDVGAPVGPKGKAPGQGVEGGLPGTGDAGVRLRMGLADEDREKKVVLATS